MTGRIRKSCGAVKSSEAGSGKGREKGKRELSSHGTAEFPCAGYAFPVSAQSPVPWHWHEEMEIIGLKSGEIKVLVPGKEFHLKAGGCIVINSNVPHSAEGEGEGELRSIVFHPLLAAGTWESVFAKKYSTPLTEEERFLACMGEAGGEGRQESGKNRELAEHFWRAFQGLEKAETGFEFTVREEISRICLLLYQELGIGWEQHEYEPGHDSVRIRKMLGFIHSHYASGLTLSEIAASAGIGERECLRCFQRSIRTPPMQYLLKYRIMQGAAMLLAEPEKSIAQVAADCGFDSPSNFSMMFRRFYGQAPREYRRGLKGGRGVGAEKLQPACPPGD